MAQSGTESEQNGSLRRERLRPKVAPKVNDKNSGLRRFLVDVNGGRGGCVDITPPPNTYLFTARIITAA